MNNTDKIIIIHNLLQNTFLRTIYVQFEDKDILINEANDKSNKISNSINEIISSSSTFNDRLIKKYELSLIIVYKYLKFNEELMNSSIDISLIAKPLDTNQMTIVNNINTNPQNVIPDMKSVIEVTANDSEYRVIEKYCNDSKSKFIKLHESVMNIVTSYIFHYLQKKATLQKYADREILASLFDMKEKKMMEINLLTDNYDIKNFQFVELIRVNSIDYNDKDATLLARNLNNCYSALNMEKGELNLSLTIFDTVCKTQYQSDICIDIEKLLTTFCVDSKMKTFAIPVKMLREVSNCVDFSRKYS